MIKKVISFIIILLVYITAGASVLLSTSFYGLGIADSDNGSINYAYALDRAGDIYYIKDADGVKSLCSVDSSGKRLFEKKLDPDIFGSSFYIGEIYVEHDKNIFVTSYEYDESTLFVKRASVHQFHEDGSYADEIFGRNVSVYSGGDTNIISSMSEDDNSVFFSILTDGKAEVFTSPKNNSEPASKIKEYDVGNERIYGWITASTGDIIVGREDGAAVYSSSGKITLRNQPSEVFDRFWNGIDLYYTLDSASGTVYVISSDYSVSSVITSGKIINAENGLTVADMDDVAVGITGNILGVRCGTSDALYLGSFSVMSEIYTDSVDKGAVINIVLAGAATVLAVLFLTVLTWDFYCSILKMRLSILLRQSLLIAMLIFVGLYSLSYFVVIPQVENIVTSDYRNEVQLIANSFVRAMEGAAENSESASPYRDFLTDYGNAAAANPDNEFQGDDELPEINLFTETSDGYRILASGDLYPEGYPVGRLFYGFDFDEAVRGAQTDDVFIISRSKEGERLCLIRKIELEAYGGDAYIAVAARISGLSSAVENIRLTVNMFLVIGGIVIVIFFMIIENITAGAVRKLKRSVDKIARGDYGSRANIRTGDEVEALSSSVNALAEHIVDKTTSLERLNNSYYRFVPLSFLKNLGETQIENVSKSLHTKKSMTTMYLRFEFSQNLTSMESEDIFESINSVFELITPVIGQDGGTAYNFVFNGFNAIFPETAENALQAAIKIREMVGSFNEIQRVKGKRTADVRIVIGKDDVLLGFIGDEKRMEPTAVSAVINESEEIEKICSGSGLYIAATEAAFSALPSGKYRSRCIGRFVTSDGAVHKLYDLFDSDPYSLIKLKEQFMTRFELGVSLFEKADYANARNMFMNIVKYAADDGVSRNYMYLAEHNLTSENKQTTYNVYGK